MSQTEKKTSQQLQQEYTNLACRVGNTQYEINSKNTEVKRCLEAMESVALEYTAAKAREDLEKAEAAAKASEPKAE